MNVKVRFLYRSGEAVRTDLIEKEIEVTDKDKAMPVAYDLWFSMCEENKNLKLNSIKGIKTEFEE